MIPFWHATASGMPAMFEPRHSPDVGTWRAGAIPCAPGSLAAPPTTLARESGPRVDKLVPYLFYLSVCEVDVIRTTTRRRHGRGHRHPQRRRSEHCCISRTGYGCAATPAAIAQPWPLCRLSFGGVPDASSDVLRQHARCTVCARRGASLQHPSWADAATEWQSFPAA
jgi:hypothetical protein